MSKFTGIVYIDMDGVLANFCKAVCDTFNADYEKVIANWDNQWDIPSQLGITKGQMWSKIDNISDWWDKIEPYPWAHELLSIIKPYENYILSAPHINPHCVAGKTSWLKKHTKFGDRIIFTKYKYLCAGPDRILIDDNDKKCEEFESVKSSKIILFPQVWNKNRHFCDSNRMEFVKNELEKFKNS